MKIQRHGIQYNQQESKMAKQILNVGTSNNDKSGDTLRAGGLKIKANFEEIYAALAQDGSNISGGNVLKTGSYADLSNKPEFANIALSGSFDDLLDKPNFVTTTATPENLVGYEGQMAGNIAFDSNNLYVAINSYDGESLIWKTIPWGGGGTSQGYNYNHNQDPTSVGGFSLDNEDPSLATVAYISTSDIDGNDIHPFYQYIFDNNLNANLEIISRTNPANRALFKVIGSREMESGGIEYYEIDLEYIMHADAMTIGTGTWDLHFDFTGNNDSSSSSLVNGETTADLGEDGVLVVNNGIAVESNYQLYNSGNLVGRINNAVSDGGGLQLEGFVDFEIKVTQGEGQETAIYGFNSNGVIELPNSIVVDTSEANLEFRRLTNFNIEAESVVNIYTNTEGAGYQWQFGDNGLLSLPGEAGIYASEGEVIIGNGIGPGGIPAMPSSMVTVGGSDPLVIARANGTNNPTWIFKNDGTLRFPNNTHQTTAWSGGRVVDVPSSSAGSEGDLEGDLAFNNTHMYYCSSTYSSTPVTVSWSNVTNFIVNPNYIQADIANPSQLSGVLQVTNCAVNGVTGVTITIASVELVSGNTYKLFPVESGFESTYGNSELINVGLSIWKRVAWSGDTW